ncbi:outer membrane beta-barrel protein [Candidatus Bathyarchaeota archaeon]|nr:outer membrane beta-barrel protein [Candidatus Bathyarchaeota archaeon]
MGPPTAGLKTGQFRVGVEYAYSDVDMELEGEELDGVTSNMIFGNLGYGIMDDWEAFVRLGVANVDVEDFSGDYGLAWGLETKVTFLKQENLNWGALFQMTWSNSEDEDVEFDFYDMQIAVGPTWKLSETLSIYGGPFVHLIDGDVSDDNGDLEEDSAFGGYVGAEAALADNTSLFGEVQFTGAGWAIGTGVAWKF